MKKKIKSKKKKMSLGCRCWWSVRSFHASTSQRGWANQDRISSSMYYERLREPCFTCIPRQERYRLFLFFRQIFIRHHHFSVCLLSVVRATLSTTAGVVDDVEGKPNEWRAKDLKSNETRRNSTNRHPPLKVWCQTYFIFIFVFFFL
jgi:hypothetical protein